MKPKVSPLSIIDFAIVNYEYSFIQPQDERLDPRDEFDNYELDVDFIINKDKIIHVLMKAEVNRGKQKLPGYSIFAEAVCFFKIDGEIKLSDEAKNSIEGFSTIYIALNTLRGFISQLTAIAPLGRYILPSIDLNDLIVQKQKMILENQTEVTVQKKDKGTKKQELKLKK